MAQEVWEKRQIEYIEKLKEQQSRFGTSLQETRGLMGALGGVSQPAFEKIDWSAITAQKSLNPQEAANYGYDVPEGWNLRLTPLGNGQGRIGIVAPEGWEATTEGKYVSPEGKEYTEPELTAVIGQQEQAKQQQEQAQKQYEDFVKQETGMTLQAYTSLEDKAIKVLEGILSPEDIAQIDNLTASLGDMSDESIYNLFEWLRTMGRNENTEAMFVLLKGGQTNEEQIADFFDITDIASPQDIVSLAVQDFNKTGWLAAPDKTAIHGMMGFSDFMGWLSTTKVGKTLGVAGAWMDKYIGKPWEAFLMEVPARIGVALGDDDPVTKKMLTDIDTAREKYGAFAIFDPNGYALTQSWWEQYKATAKDMGKFYEIGVGVVEFMNPVYFIPIGGAFGKIASMSSKVPIIGNLSRLAAKGVIAVEKGMAEATLLPTAGRLTAKMLSKVGEKVGDELFNRIISQSKSIDAFIKLPDSKAIVDTALKDNWMRKTINLAAKLPPVRTGIERALGWRITANRVAKTIEDVVAQGAVVHAELTRMGANARAIPYWTLKETLSNPVKYFGFNKQGLSEKMVGRLRPLYAEQKNVAGTLEHVFTHPEMYNWDKMADGLLYVSEVNRINTEVLTMLTKEGVAPANVLDDWIHRIVVVEGKGRGVGRGTVGKTMPYEKHRKFETMMDGIQYFVEHPELGARYVNNPEILVSGYIEEAFKKVADNRFINWVSEGLDAMGATTTTASAKLLDRYPELVQRVILKTEEVRDAKVFSDVINRTLRGEQIPTQTVKAIEKRFPDFGKRFRNIVSTDVGTEEKLRSFIATPEVGVKSPTLKQTRAIFQGMDFERRLAYRDGLAKQVLEASGKRQGRLKKLLEVLDDTNASYTYSARTAQVPPEVLGAQATHQPVATTFKKAKPLTFATEVAKSKRSAFLTQYTEEELSTFKLYTSADGKVGYAIKPDGDIVNVFNNSGVKGLGEQAVIDAIANGGKKLDCFDGFLPKYYRDFGFKVTKRAKWDEKYAPKRWDSKTYKNPDVVYMEYKGGTKDANIIRERFEAARSAAIRRGRGAAGADVELFGRTGAGARGRVGQGQPETVSGGVAQPSVDVFDYAHPVMPRGRPKRIQLTPKQYADLIKKYRAAGVTPPDVIIHPKIEGEAGETTIEQLTRDIPAPLTEVERAQQLDALRAEVSDFTARSKPDLALAKAERTFRMEQMRQADIGEAYLMQPFAGGKLYDQEFVDAFNKFFGHEAGNSVLRVTSDIAGILRVTKAALDVSMMAIQGMPSWGLAHAYLFIDPAKGARLCGAWYKAWAYSIRGFLDPQSIASYVGKNQKTSLERISFGGSSRAVYLMEELEATTGMGKVAKGAEWGMEHIPLKPYERAETAFFGAGEIVRNEFWKILSPKALERGQQFELSRFLDRMTGVTDARSLGVPMSVRQIEQTFGWFAPNYTRACLTLLADVFRGGMTGAEARKALGGMISCGAIMYSGVQYAISSLGGKDHEEAWNDVLAGFGVNQDPITGSWDWKPTGKFMTLQVGNYNMGFGGFWYGLVRLFGNIMATADNEPIDFIRIVKDGQFNVKDNPFLYWWYSRSSPITGIVNEMSTGRDFLGYPFEGWQDYVAYIGKKFEPVWMESGVNPNISPLVEKYTGVKIAQDNEMMEGAARVGVPVAEMFGLRTFPNSSWVDFYDKASEHIRQIPVGEIDDKQKKAWSEGKMTWEHLTTMQKNNLLYRYPELLDLYSKAQGDSAVRSSDDWKNWEDRQAIEKKTYYDRGNAVLERVRKGELTTAEFREYWSEAGQMYGKGLDDLESNPAYADIYEFLDAKKSEGNYLFADDLALQNYIQAMFTEYTDANGDPDWSKREEAVNSFIERYGEDTYQRIRQMYSQKRLMDGLDPALAKLSDDKDKLTKAYWQLPYKAYYQMKQEDIEDGSLPVNQVAVWNAFQSLDKQSDKDAFLKAHPDFARDWRAEYRAAHPEEDAILAIWGYGGKLQTIDAYNLVVKWSVENKIPLSQMGLGLPPQNLISDYFELNKVVLATSPNSAETRLFKLEHPDYLQWGLDQKIWSDDLSSEHIEALRITVKYTKEDDEYNAIKDKDQKKQTEARLKYLEAHPEYSDARRERQAWDADLDAALIPLFVEYFELPSKGNWRERYLLDHPEFYKAMMETFNKMPIDEADVKPVQYDEIYQKYQPLFDEYYSVTGNAQDRANARAAIMEKNPEFQKAFYERQGWGLGFKPESIPLYTQYSMLPDKGWDKERFLKEHQDFYKEAWSVLEWSEPIDFNKTPTVELEKVINRYDELPANSLEKAQMRCGDSKLDGWLVYARKLQAAYGTYRCNMAAKPPKLTPQEEKAWVKQFIEGLQK